MGRGARKHYRRKHGDPDAPVSDVVTQYRSCLMCDASFQSFSQFNKVCPECKTSTLWKDEGARDGYYDHIAGSAPKRLRGTKN